MRLFLLPVSTRRTLIYCERVADDPNASRSILDRATNKAADTWASWEKKDNGWQKTIVTYGNKILRRIPFEEWGLKSVPPLTKAREELWRSGKSKMDVLFPGLYLHESEVPKIIQALAVERQNLHRRKLYWSLVGMPITAPFALVPVIPNIPFFYLAFRAYSHWKGMSLIQHPLTTIFGTTGRLADEKQRYPVQNTWNSSSNIMHSALSLPQTSTRATQLA